MDTKVAQVDNIVIKLKELRDLKASKTAELKDIEAELENTKNTLISLLVDLNKTAWEVEGVGRASITTKTYWSIKDQVLLRKFLEESGNDALIKISAQAITGFFNEFKNDHDLPVEKFEADFGVSFFPKTTISLRTK